MLSELRLLSLVPLYRAASGGVCPGVLLMLSDATHSVVNAGKSKHRRKL